MADVTQENFENDTMETVWVESHPECSVCLQPCLHPVQTPCLHIFCFLCLKGFVYRSKKCALCRSQVQLEYFENPVIVKVRSEEAQCTSTATENYNWFYEGRNGWWEYDERASATLEEAFNSDECRSCELLISGFTYFVDFEDMVQFRKSHPARRRRIKRDRVGVERKGVAGLKLKNKTEEIDDPNSNKDKNVDRSLKKSDFPNDASQQGSGENRSNVSDDASQQASGENRSNVSDDASQQASGENRSNVLNDASQKASGENQCNDVKPEAARNDFALSEQAKESPQDLTRESPQGHTRESAGPSQNGEDSLSELLNETL